MLTGYWKGHKKLWEAYWYIYIIPSVGMPVIASSSIWLFGLLFHYPFYQLMLIAFTVIILFNPFYIFSWVAIIRCRNNTTYKLWGLLAVFSIVIHILLLLVAVYSYLENIYI